MQTYEEYLASLQEGQEPLSKEEFDLQQNQNVEEVEEVERSAEELAEIQQNFNQVVSNLPEDNKVNLSFSIAKQAGLSDFGGSGSKRVSEKEFMSSDYAFNKALEVYDEVSSKDFIADVTEDEIKKEAANIYFDTANILDYEVVDRKGSKSAEQAAVREFRKKKLREINPDTIGIKGYPKGRPYTEQEIQAMPEMIELRRRSEKKFANKEEYEAYRKETLGDKYNDFLKWESGDKNIEIPLSAIQAGEDKIFADKLNVAFRDMFDGPGGELIQKNVEILASLNKNPQEQFESTVKVKELIEVDKKIIAQKENALIKAQQPFIDNINNTKKEIDDLGFSVFDTVGTLEINEDGSIAGGDYITVDYEEAEKKVAEYNDLVEKYKEAYVEYEKQDFEGQYNILVKDQQNLQKTINKYNSDIQKYAQTGEQASKDFLIAKAAGYDYSLTYRAGAAMEDFFIKGGRNFATLTGQAGLKVIKALVNNPASDIYIDNAIKNMSESLANYNQRLAKEREEKLPPALTLDDVEFGASGNGVLQYIGEALADNSPSIITTFIPAGAAIAGGARIAGAAGLSAVARKEAADAAKKYGLYAMRAAQGIFFAGESGGKYGDILVEEYNKKDRIKQIDDLIDKGGLTDAMRNDLIDEKESLNQMLNTNFSFAQKAFASYGFGATAALAETMGSLKLVSSVGKAAGAYGKIAVKKELYKNATKFSGVLAKGFIRGLRPAITKAMPTEVFEEAFTQISHNAIDVIALNEDKSILEGLNADFFVKTAITSFAIMGPTTMNNTRQILQNEFKTKNEIAQNSKDVNELIVIQQQLEGLKGPQRNELNKRRRALVKKLGFYDAQILNKLNSMTTSEIKEVAEIGRQQRALATNMRGLAGTGGSIDQNNEYVKTKKSIENQFNNLENRKNELLGRHDQKMLDKMTQINKELGISSNLDLAYSLGLNDFATNAALTMSDAGKKFTEITSEDFNNPEAIRKQLKAEGYTDSQIETVVEKFTGDTASNAMYFPETGDILINQGAIDIRMHSLPAGQANYAALAPLEELFHATISQKGLRVEGELRKDAEQSTQQLLDLIKGKMEVGTPAQQQKLQDLLKRVELYKKDGKYNYEEMLAQVNNAMLMGALNSSDFVSLPSLKSFLNKAISKIMGDPAWMLELNEASDVAEFMRNWQNNILEDKAVLDQTPPEDEVVAATPTVIEEVPLESIGETLPQATQAYMELDNSMLQQGLNSAIQNNTDQQFPLAQALVEKNWGLISPSLNINSEQEMNAAKEVVIDQLLGKFEGSGVVQFGTKKYPARGTSALAGFSLDPEGGSNAAQVSTYLTETIKKRKPEIDAAIADKTKAGIEVNTGITEGTVTQIETTEVETTRPLPSETTKYSDAILETVNTDKAGLETRITEAVQESYPGRTDVRLAETRNIPQKVAEIYTEMLGITNPNRLTDKSQTFSVTDEAGLRNAQMFLTQNAQADFANLPNALDADGRGTFIPLNVKRALYTDGKKTGTLKDYLDLIKIPATKKIYRDSAKVGTIRGLLSTHIRNRILETANPDSASRIASGAKFSKGEVITKKAKQAKKTRDRSVAQQKLDSKRLQEIGRISRINTSQVLKENNIKPLEVKPGKGKLADKLTDEGRRIRNESVAAALPKLGLNIFKGDSFYTSRGIFKNKADFDSVFNTPLTQEFIDANNLKNFVTTDGTGVTTLDKSKLPKEGIDQNNTYTKAVTEQKNYKNFSLEQRKQKLEDKGFQDLQKNKIKVLNNLANVIEQEIRNEDGSINAEKAAFWAAWLGTSSNLNRHPIRALAPITFFSNSKLTGRNDYVAEHTMPANIITSAILDMALQGRVGTDFKFIENNYQQGQLLKSDDNKVNIFYKVGVPQEFFDNENATVWIRYAHTDLNNIDTEGGINLNNYLTTKNFSTNVVTVAESLGLGLDETQYKDNGNDVPAIIHYQNELLYDLQVDNELKASDLKKKLDASIPVKKAEQIQTNKNANELGGPLKTGVTPQAAKDTMVNSLQSKGEAFKKDKPTKGISVFDFDDTLAKTKEKVIVNMPDGEIKEISASEFAETADQLTADGATFDFSNFDKVSKSTAQGPLADLARRRQEKFGSKDIFVLTARPQASAASIKQFLDSIGINIPMKNITGLEDGSPQAKVDWVLNKTAEGYNDFYFADDSLANVEGVRQVLNALDVKNDVQQALESKGEKLNKDFNKQIEEVTGVGEFKQYSTARARLEGKKKDGGFIKRFARQFTITPSADDFLGLMYAVVGKGEQGNKHLKFIKDNLVDVYDRAEQQLLSAKVSVARDFAALRSKFPTLKGSKLSFANPLLKEIDGGPFNKEQAVRVYIWNKQGMEIPDMAKRDINRLVKAVEADPELSVFADELQLIQKSKQYPAPGKNWLGGSIKNDILDGLDTSFRAELMKEFNENVDAIFNDAMFNKLEAIYGSKYVEALKDSLRRMKSGNNRPVIIGAGAGLVNEMLDWLNASVANVMFLNMRSGLLQTLSTVNFINWGDNNIYNAAKAFASEEMWPTFMRLMNSDYLVNRRDGLKINVNEAELADAAKKGGIKGAFSYLLDKGFAITRVMDSFAIALGGATFFINRKKALLNRVNEDTGKIYTEAEADQKAFEDFYQVAEETQQSSNPSKISSQQASFAGRILLSFQNVTMQFNRKTKKSVQDLYNRRKKPGMTQRESDLSNLSSIIYYVGIQNLMFNALQQAIFALAFDDEEEQNLTKQERVANIANGMTDSLLFGLGFGGAIVATTKNILRRIADENTKKKPDYRDIPDDVFDVSSVVDAKYRKLKTAARTFTFNRKEIKERGWSLDNPAYLAVAQIISAVTNAPIDRVLQKVNNLRQASDESTRMWQRVALVMGWNGWNFGLPYWGRQSTIDQEDKENEKVKENYQKQVKKIKSMGFTKKIPLSGPNHYKPKGELGVDYVQVERPSGEIQYYIKP